MPKKKTIAESLQDEMNLRKWARENYVGSEDRDASWHPIVLAEMEMIETEMNRNLDPFIMQRYVPLEPTMDPFITLHAPHEKLKGPQILKELNVPSENFVG